MDKKRSILNVIVSVISKFVLLIVSMLVRRYLIQIIGSEANGLNSLYLSIIGFLSVAELGVGSAITFCMYKPIVDGNVKQVAALYNLFTKTYRIIGIIILTTGLCITPFLKYLAKDYSEIGIDMYSTFLLMLASIVVTYLYSAKLSVLNAYKDNYIATGITSAGNLLQYVLQIVVLFLTRSFTLYLICRIIAALAQWIPTNIIVERTHKDIIHTTEKIDNKTKKNVLKNIKALFMHKIGNVLVNTVDSMIISAFIGIVILGKYSNYTIIMTSMVGIITLFFTPLTSIIGHLYAKESVEETYKYYNFFYGFNMFIGCVFFLGYYATIDNIVSICFGDGLELSKTISYIITLNYFIQFMRRSTMLFRDATGTYYYDRWKPILEGICNLILSIFFVNIFPDEFNLVGVIVATIMTNIFICHIIEPYVLFKYAFKKSVKKQYLTNYCYLLFFALLLIFMNKVMIVSGNEVHELLINGCISLLFSFVVFFLLMLVNKDFRLYTKKFLKKVFVH